METIIYLIRHSKSLGKKDIKFNADDSEQIINEKLPLSTIGEEKAKKLSTWNEFNKIDYVFTSNYVRAISTGKYIALKNNIPIVVDKRLNERKIGDAKNVRKEFWLTQLNDKDAKLPNGESRSETCERMLSFINEVIKQYKGKKIVVVSHAIAITALLMNYCELVSASLEGKKRHLVFNGRDVINDSFNKPEVFKLVFKDDIIIDVSIVRKQGDEQ